MQTALDRLLDHLNFEHRPQQKALFEALSPAPEMGLVAQAGTGVGKSIAILAAAAEWRELSGKPALVVCPMNSLLDQYVDKDGPTVAAALDMNVVGLKGRRHYLCQSSPGMQNMLDKHPRKLIDANFERLSRAESRMEKPPMAVDPSEWGCPGSDECDPETSLCGYRQAKALAQEADIVITNAHIFIIDRAMKERGEKAASLAGQEATEKNAAQGLLPEFGAVFVDEAHTLESVLRDFTASSLNAATLENMGCNALADRLKRMNVGNPDAKNMAVDAQLAAEINAVARWRREPWEKKNQRHEDARNAAQRIIELGLSGAYKSRDAVLYFQPERLPRQPRLVSEQVNLAGTARRLLTTQPFALVSATTPASLRGVLGISDADFVDVGHPFDYAKQASISFSSMSGAYRERNVAGNFTRRINEIRTLVEETKGGALILFSSLRDMRRAHEALAYDFASSGMKVLTQDSDTPNSELGQQFAADGNAVLFGSETFATGFDVPGSALRLVIVWTLPYAGLSPVTRAISESSFQRYEDIMLMKAVQAAGRLIRTQTDEGHVHFADSRARRKLLNSRDPMVKHMSDFKVVEFS